MSVAPSSCVSRLKLRDVRCFGQAEIDFPARATLLVGDNAQGKTSLLEAVCILLRLQSPRTTSLAHAIRQGARGLVVDGHCNGRHLQFYYSAERRKLALDSVVQSNAREYLNVARVAYFSNEDIRLITGGAALRRRFLDFAGTQLVPAYRPTLREFERALRSRNRLLKQGGSACGRELDAFTGEFLRHGNTLFGLRSKLVTLLEPKAVAAHSRIAGSDEAAAVHFTYRPGGGSDLAAALSESRLTEREAGQTLVGPHRDDIEITLNSLPTADFASEGQQRTLALALRLGVAELLREASPDGNSPPLFLIDDVFGELDKNRRNAFLEAIPSNAQMIATTTHLDWMTDSLRHASIFRIHQGEITRI